MCPLQTCCAQWTSAETVPETTGTAPGIDEAALPEPLRLRVLRASRHPAVSRVRASLSMHYESFFSGQ